MFLQPMERRSTLNSIHFGPLATCEAIPVVKQDSSNMAGVCGDVTITSTESFRQSLLATKTSPGREGL